jgi:hypothetical protein
MKIQQQYQLFSSIIFEKIRNKINKRNIIILQQGRRAEAVSIKRVLVDRKVIFVLVLLSSFSLLIYIRKSIHTFLKLSFYFQCSLNYQL